MANECEHDNTIHGNELHDHDEIHNISLLFIDLPANYIAR